MLPSSETASDWLFAPRVASGAAPLWRVTDNSGLPQIGAPTTGGLGEINAGYLEQSNVDLGSEFADMIVTQRGFQANTRIVSVVDELLADVVNMKR